MLASLIATVVAFSRRFALVFVIAALAASWALGSYVAGNIKINTNIDELMAYDLGWRKLERELAAAFPHKQDRLVIVIDGATPDAAERAATILSETLQAKKDLFKSVSRPDALPFFRKNGLLFLSEEELAETLDTIIKAQPMIGTLVRDSSLRGLFSTMELALQGIEYGQASYDSIAPSLALISQTIDNRMEGGRHILPWQSMMSSGAPKLRDTRKFIIAQPALDFESLSPGAKASAFVRKAAEKMHLTPEEGVTIRLTGSVALNDEEFASVAQGAEIATLASLALVILLLVLALKSWRLIVPIVITLLFGLVATTAFALATVGSLNLISVAFAVMFVGMAVDFGIQFGVRFRDEHYKEPDTTKAMTATARTIASPITFAALCSALGFLAFVPTDYRGVSELGIIAGGGMIIAYLLNLTLLPALITLFKPGGEKEAIGYGWAAPIDLFLVQKRKMLMLALGVAVIVSAALASQMRFDYDPLNLKNPDTESVSTMFDIMKDPNASPYTAEILAPSLEEAEKLAAKLNALPEVDHTITLASFVPENQESKLAMIKEALALLETTLNPPVLILPPSMEQNYNAALSLAEKLDALGKDKKEAAALAASLRAMTESEDLFLPAKLEAALIEGFVSYSRQLKTLLAVEAIDLSSISEDLRKDWMTADGRARIEVHPKGNPRDHTVLSAFTKAVRTIEPNASGTSISIQESGKTVSSAFMKAAGLAILVISLIGLIVLRRLADVARLILPLIIAGLFTMATMVAINLPLNFANIIALPLLLSLGVTYTIYFISYWKEGQINPLQSSMARAVLFSAGTTLVAFGSLSLSSHTGTSGMGILLTIALLYSVFSTFLVLPVLLDRNPSYKQEE